MGCESHGWAIERARPGELTCLLRHKQLKTAGFGNLEKSILSKGKKKSLIWGKGLVSMTTRKQDEV